LSTRGIKRFDFLSNFWYNIYVKKRKQKKKRRTLMTDFTPIRNALDNLLAVLDSATADLVGTANAQRRELLDLYGRMQATNADLIELGSIVGDAGAAMLNIEEMCEDVASKAQNVIEGGLDEIPAADYEDFVGFCETCGNEILVSEEYDRDGDGELVCADCLNAEAEQLTINLAESTALTDTDTH
jgi:hypothetical protein